jgi:hypothetical protein
LATSTVAECESLFLRISADLGRVNIAGAVPVSLTESQRQLDVLAGRLAELARDPGHISAQAPLAELRETVDGLRLSLKGFGGAHVSLADTLSRASAELSTFEAAAMRFRDQIEPPAPGTKEWK